MNNLPDECTNTDIDVLDRIKSMLHPDILKVSSVMISDMFERRKELMYNVDEDDFTVAVTSANTNNNDLTQTNNVVS